MYAYGEFLIVLTQGIVYTEATLAWAARSTHKKAFSLSGPLFRSKKYVTGRRWVATSGKKGNASAVRSDTNIGCSTSARQFCDLLTEREALGQ